MDLAGFLLRLGDRGHRGQDREGEGGGLVEKRTQKSLTNVWSRRESQAPRASVHSVLLGLNHMLPARLT